ncbi:response regulator transcription factor [Ensifer sp. ENS11]|nr:response regulator transcription factor [Ensifer sp. ENS11]
MPSGDNVPPRLARILLASCIEGGRRLGGPVGWYGIEVTTVRSVGPVTEMLKSGAFDLLVIDAVFGSEPLLQLCRQVRAFSTLPILVLSKEHDDIITRALEAGADDGVAAWVGHREITARIHSLLRRASYGSRTRLHQRVLVFDGWRLDPLRRSLVDPNGVFVTLSAVEFDILLALCRRPGEVISRKDLLVATHAGQARPVERCVDVHISRIRKKIEVDPRHPMFLKTVRLGGYLFAAIVEFA